jgi:hypothetical protein
MLRRFLQWISDEQNPWRQAQRNIAYRKLERAEVGDISVNAIRSRLALVQDGLEQERVSKILAFTGKRDS